MKAFLKSILCISLVAGLAACGGGGDSRQRTNCSLTGAAPIVPAQTGTVGTAYSRILVSTAAVPAGCALSFAATSLPPGLSIRANDGLVSGTPTTAGRFSSSIIINVSSTDGGTGDSRSIAVLYSIL